MHPNEPVLVFRKADGTLLPTAAFLDLDAQTPALSAAQRGSLLAQARRQSEVLP